MAAYCQVYGVIHFTSPAGWLPVHWDQLRVQRSVTSMGNLYLFTFFYIGQVKGHVVPINKIWRRNESTPHSRWWRSHIAGIYSDCSTREINNILILWINYSPNLALSLATSWILRSQRSSVGWLGLNGIFNTDLVKSRHYRTNINSKLGSIMGNTAK